jgi:hypothetical protein
VSSPGIRERFWSEALALLEGPGSWPERFEALEALVARFGNGRDLIHASPLPGSPSLDAVCMPLPDEVVGYRSFLIEWQAGASTLTHGHPGVMFVYPISTHLEAIEYDMIDGRPQPQRTTVYGPGETMQGAVDNDRHDNFMHSLRCRRPGWSLHIYSDWGGRGPRFDEAGERLPPKTSG